MSTQPPGGGEDDHPTVVGLQPGQRVGLDRYSLTRLIGQGGMGVVWLARDESLDEEVALKFLPPQIRFDPTALDDLRRETTRSRRLTHTNIIRIHDLFEAKGLDAFISMEFVNGQTLSTLRLQQPGRVFAWDYLAHLVRQLCDALEYAHGEKVIHRDLKPANLMIDTRGRLKLADFGIARVVTDSMSRVSVRKETSGTLVYMSPQQLDGKPSAPTDDLYSFGATLYELLTSKPPFYTGDITHQIRYIEPEPMSDRLTTFGINNAIPAEVEEVVAACLSKNPDQRPQGARDIAGRLGLGETRIPTTKSKVKTARVKAIANKFTEQTSAARGCSFTVALTLGIVATLSLILLPFVQRKARDFAQNVPGPVAGAGGAIPVVVVSNPIPTINTTVVISNPIPPVDTTLQAELDETRRKLLASQSNASVLADRTRAAAEAERRRIELEKQAIEAQRHQSEEAQRAAEALRKYPRLGEPWTNTLQMVFLPIPGSSLLFCDHEARVMDFSVFAVERKLTIIKPSFNQTPAHPVVNVTWSEAKAFCEWLTVRERAAGRLGPDQSYRLPTDLEWSAAAGLPREPGKTPRARSGKIEKRYPWGADWPPPKDAGNLAGAEVEGRNITSIRGYDDKEPVTAPVGRFTPSANGLHDLAGNVWELCSDLMEPQSPYVVSRGGAWDTWNPDQLLSSYRNGIGISLPLSSVGFRCVLQTEQTRSGNP